MNIKKVNKDFDYLVINTPNDWLKGQATSLSVDDKGQLLLASKELIPLLQGDKNKKEKIEAISFAFDSNNCLYLIEQNSLGLFRYSRQLKVFQKVGCREIAAHEDQTSNIHPLIETQNIKCNRIAFSKFALYVLDTENGYIHSFYYPSFQLRFSIRYNGESTDRFSGGKSISLENPIEILTDNNGNLYVLDAAVPQILLINQNGNLLETIQFDKKDPCHPKKPLAMTVAPSECLYVLDAGNDSSLNAIQKWDKNQNKWIKVAEFLSSNTQFQSLSIAVDKNNIISISGQAKHILQFTETGEYWGRIELETECLELVAAHNGELYGLGGPKEYDLRLMTVTTGINIPDEGLNLILVALVGTDLHIRIFDDYGGKVVDKAENELVSGETLVALKKRLVTASDESYLSIEDKKKIIEDATLIAGHVRPEKQIFHFGSNTQYATKGSYISKIFDSKTFKCQWHRLFLDITISEKTQFQVYYYASDDKINPDEIESEQKWQSFLNNSNYGIKDALFENAIGQYLVLKFEFSSNGQSSPLVRMAQVYFQRDSYLRFLPAVYQEDPRGKDFLERFLALYETMFLEIEEKINHITQYFDVDVPDKEFLNWLSSWFAVIVDENWPESKRRMLLKEAFELYKYRGTQKTLRRMIEIFVGDKSTVTIIEHWRLRPPMVVHQSSIVGVNSFVGPKRTQRLILEETSRIGEFVLEENEDSPEKPFAIDAYDFTVLVDTSQLVDADYLKTLQRLIEDEKPAHTRYFLRTTQGAVAQLGKQSLLGVNTVLSDGPKPMHLNDKNANIGKTTLVGTQYPTKGTIGARSRISKDTILH